MKENNPKRCKTCGYCIRTTYERHVTGRHHLDVIAGKKLAKRGG